jgi:histone-lysine N-methyltransferase SETMAR
LFRDHCSINHHGWQLIVTLDESWFYLNTDHGQMWFQPNEEPPERPRHTIHDEKMMVTIAWNALGFHLLDALPKGNSFTGAYYRDNILAGLLPLRPASGKRQLCLHADNARVHTAQKCREFCHENGLRILTQPAYSPDLAPSDFFLFGHVKHCLAGMSFASRDDLFEAIRSVVMAIPTETLHRVFDHWLERLEWVAQNNGDYYP